MCGSCYFLCPVSWSVKGGDIGMYKGTCTIPWKKAKSKRSPLDSRAKISYEDKDSPDYVRAYPPEYTERQTKILSGEIPIDDIRLNELSIIINKAKYNNDEGNASTAEYLYLLKKHPDEYKPMMELDEAKEILQSLTPWDIDEERR